MIKIEDLIVGARIKFIGVNGGPGWPMKNAVLTITRVNGIEIYLNNLPIFFHREWFTNTDSRGVQFELVVNPTPQFKIGDWVMLNDNTSLPFYGVNCRGPYQVLKVTPVSGFSFHLVHFKEWDFGINAKIFRPATHNEIYNLPAPNILKAASGNVSGWWSDELSTRSDELSTFFGVNTPDPFKQQQWTNSIPATTIIKTKDGWEVNNGRQTAITFKKKKKSPKLIHV